MAAGRSASVTAPNSVEVVVTALGETIGFDYSIFDDFRAGRRGSLFYVQQHRFRTAEPIQQSRNKTLLAREILQTDNFINRASILNLFVFLPEVTTVVQ